MYRLLKNPITNAVGIFLFSTFYTVLFFAFSDRILAESHSQETGFWKVWDSFLQAGSFKAVALVLVVLTVVVMAILLIQHKPYDEYHTGILTKCLSVAVILTLLAIGLFFLVILLEPSGFLSKFMLFITINWSTVVMADLVYLVLCRRG